MHVPPTGYRAIADALRKDIRAGRIPAGQTLPGIRAIGEQHGVTAQTAAAAIRHLAAEGLVIVEHGRGSRVADPVPTHPPTAHMIQARLEQLQRDVDELAARVDDLERRSQD